MATINYITLQYPTETLKKHLSLIQSLPFFNVYKNTYQPGIIFRIPHGIKDGDVCHFFIEHEVNLTNTVKTGTLTMKVQITVVPCTLGLFSGFEELKGTFETAWYDEDNYGEDFFKPDYNHHDNVRKIVPLPVGIKSNLFEYLEELLFNKIEDEKIINDYVAHLGCQRKIIKEKIVFIPVPENTGKGKNASIAHRYTKHFFDSAFNGNVALIPETHKMPELDFKKED